MSNTKSGKALSERELSITKGFLLDCFFNKDFLKADLHEALDNCADVRYIMYREPYNIIWSLFIPK